jgi:hypothetical protein
MEQLRPFFVLACCLLLFWVWLPLRVWLAARGMWLARLYVTHAAASVAGGFEKE